MPLVYTTTHAPLLEYAYFAVAETYILPEKFPKKVVDGHFFSSIVIIERERRFIGDFPHLTPNVKIKLLPRFTFQPNKQSRQHLFLNHPETFPTGYSQR